MNRSHYLWEIEGNPPSYIFGTIHVPYIMLWDAIPQNTMQAFNNTQSLFLELDMSEDTLLALHSCQQLPNNQMKLNIRNISSQRNQDHVKVCITYYYYYTTTTYIIIPTPYDS